MCKHCDKKDLVTSRADAGRQSAIDIAKQMKLEKPFSADIRRLLNQILNDYQVIYSTTGQILSVDAYRDDLIGILRNHYRKTNKKFKDNITGDLEQTSEVKKLQLSVSAVMAKYIEQQSKTQAQLINKTTQDDLTGITNRVISDATKEGVQLNNSDTAQEVKKQYKPQIAPRADNIAMYETGNISAQSKETEALVVNASSLVIGGVVARGLMDKIWISTLDSKTRKAHATADGQRVPVTQNFIVGGEPLRRPRDPRGSAGNIIGCRCEAQYLLRNS